MQSSARPVPDTTLVEHDPRWARVLARDASADGQFVYAVKTTGVYCQPSSPSRLPRPENVEFFDTPADAEAAGYRPSRRAGPDQTTVRAQQAALVAQACRRIEAADTPPTLDALAQDAGLSPYHFHRLFKSVTGLTPKAYADAYRAGRLRAQLGGSASVTETLYDVGFHSSGRFYAQSAAQLGMKPATYRRGGRGEKIRFAVAQCWLGALLVAATEQGICALTLGSEPEELLRQLQDRFPHADLAPGDAAFEQTLAQVLTALDDPRQGAALPLDVRGTAFQQRVWQALRAVPPGVTLTYAELAARIGQPAAVRAVANACARNEI